MKFFQILLLLSFLFLISCNNDETVTSASPCLNAKDCKYALSLSETEEAIVEYHSSFDIQKSDIIWEELTAAVILIHGNNRNADEYFDWLLVTLASIEKTKNTLLIAPHFKIAGDINGDNDLIYWSNQGWKSGDNSENNNTETYSSYTVIDEIIEQLSDKTKFPVLDKIILTGHSSGGQFTQAYAAVNQQDNSNATMDFHYIAANSQYYFYPRAERWNSMTNQFEIPTNCPNYMNWTFGTNNLNTYANAITAAEINTNYINRKVNYLLGSSDTNTNGTFNDTDCEAKLLGATRFNRGENIFLLMETYFENIHQHQKIIVNGVGHSPQNMYQSTAAKDLLIDILE